MEPENATVKTKKQGVRAAILSLLKSVELAVQQLYDNKFKFVIVAALGLLLVTFRYFFLASLPWAQVHAKIIRDVINVFLVIFTTMENVVDIIVGAVRELIHLFRPKKPAPVIHLHSYHTISLTELTTDMTQLAATCPLYGNAFTITHRFFEHCTLHSLCPMLRALEVTPMASLTRPALGWLSAPHNPYLTTSCEITETSVDIACMSMGAGFVLIELVLPLMLVVFVLPHVLKTTYEVALALFAFVTPANVKW